MAELIDTRLPLDGEETPSSPLPLHSLERELKLLAPAGVLARLQASAFMRERGASKGTVRRLESVYFDTQDHRLNRSGLTLRVRRVGKQFIQTVKLEAVDNPLVRGQWETPVATLAPDLDQLPSDQIGEPFSRLRADDLKPIFTTRIRRRLHIVKTAEAIVEVAFDDGSIEADGRSELISEVELELRQGELASLYDLGLLFVGAAPLRLGTQSKSERGYALALGGSKSAHKALPMALASDANVDDGIAALLAGCQRHLVANLPVAAEGADIGGVHQARVALRRLRTALSLLRKEFPSPLLRALASDAKALASLLGPARNWDVFVHETVATLQDNGSIDLDFGSLARASVPFQRSSYEDLRAALSAQETNRFFLTLGMVIERRSWRNDLSSEGLSTLTAPMVEVADRALARLHRRALNQGRQFRKLEPDQRHELRLTLKNLRYAVEFFLPLYTGPSQKKPYLKRLARLQETLGAENDIATTRPLLQELKPNLTTSGEHVALGAILGWQARYQLDTSGDLLGHWEDFKQAQPFWPH
jgi:triphosphatase